MTDKAYCLVRLWCPVLDKVDGTAAEVNMTLMRRSGTSAVDQKAAGGGDFGRGKVRQRCGSQTVISLPRWFS